VIIQKAKPLDEVLDMLSGAKTVFIQGCGECAAACKVGGDEEVAEMAETLRKHGFEVTGTVVLSIACQRQLDRKELRPLKDAVEKADVVLSLCCGDGVQTVGGLLDQPVLPGVDTLFLGEVQRFGQFAERCRLCGECILGLTAGLCPKTRCPKGMVNGPCGGYEAGKCEVNPDTDCIWCLIYERLEARGQLDRFKAYQPPKDHSKSAQPASLVLPREAGGQ